MYGIAMAEFSHMWYRRNWRNNST